MRSQMPVFLVLCMAIAGLMFAGSGFNAVMGTSGHNDQVSDQVKQRAENGSVGNDSDSGFESDARTDGSGSLVGFVISGASAVWDVGELVVLLPLELEHMGFPRWFAYPIGLLTQLVVSIGLIQFASGRVWR